MAEPAISLQDLTERYPLAQDLLDKELSEEHMKKVSRIIDDHEIVGHELGLTSQEMTAVSSDANKQELQKFKMMRKWKQRYAWKATYRKLMWLP